MTNTFVMSVQRDSPFNIVVTINTKVDETTVNRYTGIFHPDEAKELLKDLTKAVEVVKQLENEVDD